MEVSVLGTSSGGPTPKLLKFALLLSVLCCHVLSIWFLLRFLRLTKPLRRRTARQETYLQFRNALPTTSALHGFRKIACLERSLALMIVGILRREQVYLVIGAQEDDISAHAWIEITEGVPLGEMPYVARLTPFFRV